MDFDLFIACEPDTSRQTRESLRATIADLGEWFQFQPCLFYLKTPYAPVGVWYNISRIIGDNASFAIVNYSAVPEEVIGDWTKLPIDKIETIWSQMQGRTKSFANMAHHVNKQVSVGHEAVLR